MTRHGHAVKATFEALYQANKMHGIQAPGEYVFDPNEDVAGPYSRALQRAAVTLYVAAELQQAGPDGVVDLATLTAAIDGYGYRYDHPAPAGPLVDAAVADMVEAGVAERADAAVRPREWMGTTLKQYVRNRLTEVRQLSAAASALRPRNYRTP